MVIREERPSDRTAVYEVESAAFGRVAEANLVERLRESGIDLISLVAEVGEQVMGHVLFSPVEVVGKHGRTPAIALGPIAMLPAFQNQGIGGQLIRAGVDACREAGHSVLFVLGHSHYYPRFGFRVSRPYGLTTTYNVPDDVFMVLELKPDALLGLEGIVHYHTAFDNV